MVNIEIKAAWNPQFIYSKIEKAIRGSEIYESLQGGDLQVTMDQKSVCYPLEAMPVLPWKGKESHAFLRIYYDNVEQASKLVSILEHLGYRIESLALSQL